MFPGCLKHKFKRVITGFRGCLSHRMTFPGFSQALSRWPGHKFKRMMGVFRGCLSHGMAFSGFSRELLGCLKHKSKLVTRDSGLRLSR